MSKVGVTINLSQWPCPDIALIHSTSSLPKPVGCDRRAHHHPDFVSQRRRWLNGSLFAALHATIYMFRIWTTGQSFFRKLNLQFELIHNAIWLVFTWTSLANFYLVSCFASTR